MEEADFDIKRICRACKMESSMMFSVFSVVEPQFDGCSLAKMFTDCTSLQVSDNDGLPTMLCYVCVEQLNGSFAFKKQCIETESFLREYLKDNSIKKESNFSKEPENEENVAEYNVDDDTHHDSPQDIKPIVKTETVECKICKKNLASNKTLKTHYRKYHSNVYKCPQCSETFRRHAALQTHLQIHENENKSYICTICHITVLLPQHLKRHLMTHLKVKPFKCELCSREFCREKRYKEHMAVCQGKQPYTCDICHEGFTCEDVLKDHILSHEARDNLCILDSIGNYRNHYFEVGTTQSQDGQEYVPSDSDDDSDNDDDATSNAFQFETCEEEIADEILENDSFSCKMESSNETSENSGSNVEGDPMIEFKCTPEIIVKEEVSKEMVAEAPVKRRVGRPRKTDNSTPKSIKAVRKRKRNKSKVITDMEEDSETFECEYCLEKLPSSERLAKHKSVKHNMGPKILPEKKFTCQICRKGFTTEKYRDFHLKSHETDKGCVCKVCGKSFKSRSHLNEHTKFHDECAKKFLCSECGQRFIRNDYLVIHMRRHRGEKPFKCKYCGKGFPRTTDLTVHERYHTGEKTHLCVICGRGFGRAYNLTVHMRTHTGEKPYKCTYCDAAFAQGNDLKAHVRRHTGERYHCDICFEGFLMGYLLTQHKRTVHGLDVKSHIRRLKPYERFAPNSQAPPTTVGTTTTQLQLALHNTTVLNIPSGISEPTTRLSDTTITDAPSFPIVSPSAESLA